MARLDELDSELRDAIIHSAKELAAQACSLSEFNRIWDEVLTRNYGASQTPKHQ